MRLAGLLLETHHTSGGMRPSAPPRSTNRTLGRPARRREGQGAAAAWSDNSQRQAPHAARVSRQPRCEWSVRIAVVVPSASTPSRAPWTWQNGRSSGARRTLGCAGNCFLTIAPRSCTMRMRSTSPSGGGRGDCAAGEEEGGGPAADVLTALDPPHSCWTAGAPLLCAAPLLALWPADQAVSARRIARGRRFHSDDVDTDAASARSVVARSAWGLERLAGHTACAGRAVRRAWCP